MPTLAQLRQQLGSAADGFTDEELYVAASAAFGPQYSDPAALRRELVGNVGKWGQRASASVDNYQGSLYGVLESASKAAGLDGVSSWAQRGREANENAAGLSRRLNQELGGIQSYKDVNSISSGLDYLGGLAVDSAPYFGEALAGGLAGRALMTGVGGLSRAGAGRLGAVGASYPSAVGDILQNQREAGDGQTNLGMAGLGGIPYAALNAVGLEGAMGAGRALSRVGTYGDDVAGIRGGLARTGKNFAIQGGIEGATEVGQEMINQGFGRMVTNPNETMFSPGAMERYAESFVGGGLLGGAGSTVTGGWRRSDQWYEQQRLAALRTYQEEQSRTPADLLAPNWTTSQGFDPAPAIPPTTSPLGDLTPEWGATLGATPPREPGMPPTGLVRSFDELRDGYDTSKAELQIPAVSGRPDFPDVMRVGAPGEVLLDDAAIQARDAYLARQAAAQAAPNWSTDLGAAPQQTQVDNAQRARATAPAFWKKGKRAQIVGKIVGDGDPEGVAQRIVAQFQSITNDATKQEHRDELANWYTAFTGKRIEDALPKSQPKEPTNVSVGTAPGQPTVGDGGAGSVDTQGSVAVPGPDAAATVGSVGTVGGVPADGAANVAAQPAQQGNDAAVAAKGGRKVTRQDVARKMKSAGFQPEQLLSLWRSASPRDLAIMKVATGHDPNEKGWVSTGAPRGGQRLMDELRAIGINESYDNVRKILQKYKITQSFTNFVQRQGGLTGLDLNNVSTSRRQNDASPSQDLSDEIAVNDAGDAFVDGSDVADIRESRLSSEDAGDGTEDMARAGGFDDADVVAAKEGGASDDEIDVQQSEQTENFFGTGMREGSEGEINSEKIAEKKKEREEKQKMRAFLRAQGLNPKQVERALKQQGKIGNAEVDAQTEKKRQEAAAAERERALEDQKKRLLKMQSAPTTVREALPDTIDDETITEAAEDWDNKSDFPWSDLSVDEQAAWVRTYDLYSSAKDENVYRGAMRSLKRQLDERNPEESDGQAVRKAEAGGGEAAAGGGRTGVDAQGNRGERAAAGGEEVGEVSKHQRPSAGTVPGARVVDKAELPDHDWYVKGASILRSLGLGHVVDMVDQWELASNFSTYHVEDDGRVVVAVKADPQRPGAAVFDMVHEIGHAVDAAGVGGIYSSHPDMAFVRKDGRIVAEGAIAKEMAGARPFFSEGLSGVLAYPLDPNQFRNVIRTPDRASQELFAQLFALRGKPSAWAEIQRYAPKTASFIQAVYDDLQANQSAPIRSPRQAARRSEAFAAAQGQSGSGVRRQGQGLLERLGSKLFSAASGTAYLNDYGKVTSLRDAIQAAAPQRASNAWTRAKDAFNRYFPAALTNFQLQEQYGDKVEGLSDYVRNQQLMTVLRNEMVIEINKVAEAWDKLAPAIKNNLHSVMLDATMKEMHVDTDDFGKGVNEHLKPEQRTEFNALRARYKALPDPAKKIYQDAKAALEKQWDIRRKAYMELVAQTISDRMTEAADKGEMEEVERLKALGERQTKEYESRLRSIKGPYFPLMRFGEYMAVGKSAEFEAAEDAIDGKKGKERKEAEARLDALKKDRKHYVVSMHEDRASAEAARKQYASEGLRSYNSLTALASSLTGASRDTVEGVVNRIRNDSSMTAAEQTRLIGALTEVFLQSLPEMHALRREAERKGVAGAETDMQRSFAAAGQQGAFYASRLKFAKTQADTLVAMEAEAKEDIDALHIVREMQKRAVLDMTYVETPVQDFVGTLSWVYHLGISPSFMVINSLQPMLVSLPVLSAKYKGATPELKRAYLDTLRVLKNIRYKNGKWDPWAGITNETVTQGDERLALRELLGRGIVDESQTYELNMYADGSNRFMSKVQRWMGLPTQQIELANRISTALATYRLERKKGSDHNTAVDEAFRTTLLTQMDYSQEGTARVMREGGGVPFAKLIFQFRRYQQGMLYVLIDNIKRAGLKDDEQKQALATVGYLSLAAAMSAGAMGLPFMGAMFLAWNAFIDDDDPEGDAETRFRNYLRDMTGSKDVADVLAKGIPAMFGADISKRIGLADVASPFPMANFDKKTGKEQVGEALVNLFGPSAGLAAQFYDGAMRFSQGDWAKGAEKMLPKAAADVIRAGRYTSDGMTDTKGELIPVDFNGWDMFLRGAGIAPTKESNYYEATRAINEVRKARDERKGQIGNAYKAALRTGDMARVRDMIEEWNEDHPTDRITGKTEIEWRRAAMKSSGVRDQETGVRLDPKRDAQYMSTARFAQ